MLLKRYLINLLINLLINHSKKYVAKPQTESLITKIQYLKVFTFFD